MLIISLFNAFLYEYWYQNNRTQKAEEPFSN